MHTEKQVGNWRPVGPFPSIAAAARKTGIHPSTIGGRLRRGWSDHDALCRPVGVNPYRNSDKWPAYRMAWLKQQLRARQLRAGGMKYRSIAYVLGCSVSKVSDLIHRKTPAYA